MVEALVWLPRAAPHGGPGGSPARGADTLYKGGTPMTNRVFTFDLGRIMDEAFKFAEGFGGHFILQTCQFISDFRWEHIQPR